MIKYLNNLCSGKLGNSIVPQRFSWYTLYDAHPSDVHFTDFSVQEGYLQRRGDSNSILGLREIAFKSSLHQQLQRSPDTEYRCCRRLLGRHCLRPRPLRLRWHEGAAAVGLTSGTMLRERRTEEGEEVRKLMRKKMAADVGELAYSEEAADALGLDGGGAARLRTAAGKKGHGAAAAPIQEVAMVADARG
jgi:hypothetical protein